MLDDEASHDERPAESRSGVLELPSSGAESADRTLSYWVSRMMCFGPL